MTWKGVAIRFLIVLLIAMNLLGDFRNPSHAVATGPCDNASLDDPNPPVGEPEPLIAGTVIDANTSTGVWGATVRLYRCNGATPAQVTSMSTDSSGNFSFPGLTGPKWYFVAVDLSGPLAGMQPAGGTANPTDLIDVGPGDGGLMLAFE